MQQQCITLTPQRARDLLDNQAANRPVKKAKVAQFAKDILDGNWRLTGDSVKVNTDGNMIDGQHRCLAVLQTDGPIQVWLTTDVPPEAVDFIDLGTRRSTGDVLHMHGEGRANDLASALSFLHRFIRADELQTAARGYPSRSEALVLLDRHPGIRDSVEAVSRIKAEIGYPLALAAANHYIFSQIHPGEAKEFFDLLTYGENLARGNPIYALRRKLLTGTTRKTRRGRDYQAELWACTIIAWNAWRKGQERMRLTWNSDKVFPRPTGDRLQRRQRSR
jgi:hypothetical protein